MATTLWPQMSCTKRETLMKHLIKGQDSANKLKILLRQGSGDRGSSSASDLLTDIMRSLEDSLSVIGSSNSGEASRVPVSTQVGSPSCGDQMSADSGASSKRPVVKDRRGSYKRRKVSGSWSKVSSSMEDGHAWRKYGQKKILQAKFPRCYYRCTHKPDQKCMALKQVQQIQEEPLMFQTTYFGKHTCRESLRSSAHQGQILLSFKSNENHHASPSSVPSVKEEEEVPREEEQSGGGDQMSSFNSIIWPELSQELEVSGGGDDEDGMSRTYSSGPNSSRGMELDMEFMFNSNNNDIESYFCFADGDEFL